MARRFQRRVHGIRLEVSVPRDRPRDLLTLQLVYQRLFDSLLMIERKFLPA